MPRRAPQLPDGAPALIGTRVAALERGYASLEAKVEHFRTAAFMAEGITPDLQTKLKERMTTIMHELNARCEKCIKDIDYRFREFDRCYKVIEDKYNAHKTTTDTALHQLKKSDQALGAARTAFTQSIDTKLAEVMVTLGACAQIKQDCQDSFAAPLAAAKAATAHALANEHTYASQTQISTIWTRLDRMTSRNEDISGSASPAGTERHTLSPALAADTRDAEIARAPGSDCTDTLQTQIATIFDRLDHMTARIESSNAAIRAASTERHTLATHYARRGRAASTDIASNMRIAQHAASALRSGLPTVTIHNLRQTTPDYDPPPPLHSQTTNFGDL